MSIHGSDHPLTIPATIRQGDGGGVHFGARFVVPYEAWGLKNVSGFLSRVAPEVEITIEGQGVLEERR
jgi:hypothetical protein